VPSAQQILDGLTFIANEWQPLAVAWHIALGALLILTFARWWRHTRVVGFLLSLPFVSVSVLAWASGNPFNGAVFAALALILAGLAARLPIGSAKRASSKLFVTGVALVVFAWIYPHFLKTDRWIVYAYASPLGLLPCPTLSAVVGVTLITSLRRSRSWSTTLAAAGVLYGVIGVFRLGVVLDVVLMIGAVVLALQTVPLWMKPDATSLSQLPPVLPR
jgi:hypothetical protein